MTATAPSRTRSSTTLIPLLALYAITMAHHLYGGLAFPGIERLVIALVFTVVIAATVWLHRRGTTAGWARWGYRVLLTLWVVVVGVIEGGYNHALFLILRLSGASSEVFRELYPDGIEIAEAGDDLFFQGTGVLTLLAVIPIVLAALRGRSAKAA